MPSEGAETPGDKQQSPSRFMQRPSAVGPMLRVPCKPAGSQRLWHWTARYRWPGDRLKHRPSSPAASQVLQIQRMYNKAPMAAFLRNRMPCDNLVQGYVACQGIHWPAWGINHVCQDGRLRVKLYCTPQQRQALPTQCHVSIASAWSMPQC